MSLFADRLATFEQLLASRRSTEDGGWPQKLGRENSATAITATAQVLEILRIRGREVTDASVQGGLRYLAAQVKEQPAAGGRGEWNRYLAYGLWGLMRYPAARRDPLMYAGAIYAYTALKRFQLPNGGWSQSRRSGPLWLPCTMVAVTALDRLEHYAEEKHVQEVQRMTTRARDHVHAEGRPRRNQMFWTQFPGGYECPGTTCLAVLTLARGSSEHREAARAGIRWLSANPDLWTRYAHIDDQVEETWWRIMSFSLGLRALLHPCAPHPVTHPAITSVIEHIGALWREDQHGWADFPGGEATTTGSYAVISAVHTLKRAWQFDPFRELGIKPPRASTRTRGASPPSVQLTIVAEEQRIRVDDEDGFVLETKISGRSQWAILLALAERSHDARARGSDDMDEMIVSLDACAKLCNDGDGHPEAALRAIKRLHAKLRKAAEPTRRSFRNLIEVHEPPGGDETYFVLEEVEVVFSESLKKPSADNAA